MAQPAAPYSSVHLPDENDEARQFTRQLSEVDATTLGRVRAEPWYSAYPKGVFYDLVAEGIQLLRRMPVPDDATPGPYTRDPRLRITRHPIFCEDEADAVYRSVDELQKHLNRVYANHTTPPVCPIPTVNLEKELVFSFCDLSVGNFMFNTDAEGQLHLYIIDFEHASFLPISFLTYVLKHRQGWATPLVAERIPDTLPQTNLEGMRLAAYMLQGPLRHIGLERTVTDDGWVVAA